jgi:cytidine deaminase
MAKLSPALAQDLVAKARAVRAHAFAPASGFRVGAAVLGGSGAVYVGCNVENASYGLTICAERAAVCAAIAAGEKEVRAVAVVTGLRQPARPCGACRQVLAEFAPRRGDQVVLLAGTGRAVATTTLAELLPGRFSFADVAKGRDRG